MSREIERALHQLRKRFAIEVLEMREARTELAECGQSRRRETGLALEKLPDRESTCARWPLLELPFPVHGLRGAGDEIDELHIAGERRQVGTRVGRLETRRRAGNLAKKR